MGPFGCIPRGKGSTAGGSWDLQGVGGKEVPLGCQLGLNAQVEREPGWGGQPGRYPLCEGCHRSRTRQKRHLRMGIAPNWFRIAEK